MADTDTVPIAVTRLLSARYPTIDVDPNWLQTCVNDLRARDAALRSGTPDQLARAVKQELLNTDLAAVVPPTYSRLFPNSLSSGKIGDAARGSILVQIESMIDIGIPLSTQLEIAQSRLEARASNVDPNAIPSDTKPTQPANDHMSDFQAQEDNLTQSSTIFPRRMLKLELSDGSKGPNVFGIELQRIAGLDMNTTKIGTKVLLKGVMVRDGYLLLTPKGVVVEGGEVREKDVVGEERLVGWLREKLGKPKVEERAVLRSTEDQNAAARVPAGAAKRDFSPDEDEYMLLAALDGSSSARDGNATARVPAAAGAEREFSPDEDEYMLLAALDGSGSARGGNTTARVPAAAAAERGFSPDEDEYMLLAALDAEEKAVMGSASAPKQHNTDAAPAPTRKPAALVVPEGMTRSQQSGSNTKREETTISIVDSDDDELFKSFDDDENEKLFASIPDDVLSIVDSGSQAGQKQQRAAAKPPASSLSNSRDDPILIESSPEP